MSSPYLDLPRRSLTEVLALKIGLAAGLNRCPHTPAGDVPVLCGCPYDRCAYLREIEQHRAEP